MNKIFSIIIPTYNCNELLIETLNSILKQDKGLFECIIIDGNSKDNTINTILDYKRKYLDNISYISEPDTGVYDAMNKGIDLSNGEYLYFIGAGDTLVDDCLTKVASKLKFNLEFVYGNVFNMKRRIIHGGSFDIKKISICGICHQAIFYKKEIFNVVGKYNLKYRVFADAELNIRCYGKKEISKNFIDVLVCDYMGNGISDQVIDLPYFEDYKKNIINNLGGHYYTEYYIKSGQYFYDLVKNSAGKKVIILTDNPETLNYIKCDIETFNDGFNKDNVVEYCTTHKMNLLNSNYDIVINGTKLSIYDSVQGDSIVVRYPYFVKNPDFFDYINTVKQDDVVIFGASTLSKKLLYYFDLNGFDIKVEYFLDNDIKKNNTYFEGKKIYNPAKNNVKNKKILIASTWKYEIITQLKEFNVNMKSIICVNA